MDGDSVHRDLRFGPFELSLSARVLRRAGVVLPLGGRALDILVYLAERPGEVIAKQELIDHVWSDVTVEEGSLRVTSPQSARRLVTANLATDTSQTSRHGATRSSAPSSLSPAIRRAGRTGSSRCRGVDGGRSLTLRA